MDTTEEKKRTVSAKHASKVGVCDVKVHNTKVKVRVVDNSDVVNLGLSELKSEMGGNMIVGLVVYGNVQTIVLCVKSRCLIIQVCLLESIPQCLTDFLEDKEFCFVGPNMETTLHCLTSFFSMDEDGSFPLDYEAGYFAYSSGMDVGYLAAKSLLDPTLLSKNWTKKTVAEHMQTIADKAGVMLDKDLNDRADKASVDLAAQAFSREELKCLVADVYASYLIASKLLGSV